MEKLKKKTIEQSRVHEDGWAGVDGRKDFSKKISLSFV